MDFILERIDRWSEKFKERLKEITEIPAPPFKEKVRGEFIKTCLEALNYLVHVDSVGNIIAEHPENGSKKSIIVAAHLDTVFDIDEINVIDENPKFSAPGIGDDSSGLVNILLLAELFINIKPNKNLVFIANVGEEGRGDLQGSKHLFSTYAKNNEVEAFITIDSTGIERVVSQSIGSLRYEVSFEGRGGHSFGSFGAVNPAFALGNFLKKLGATTVPEEPKTTYSVGILRGGTSVNSIPFSIIAEVDLRSNSQDELHQLSELVQQYAREAVEEERQVRKGELRYTINKIGDRPASNPESNFMIDMVKQVNEEIGYPTTLVASSTDANIPHSLGIPALGISGIHKAGDAHAPTEWVIVDETTLDNLKRNFLLIYNLIS